jgi:hypothetical protein
MINPLDSKSLLPMNSKLSSRRSPVVLPTFQLPCDQPSTSQLVLLALAEAHEHGPPNPSHSLPTVCAPSLELRLAKQNP